MTDENVHQLSEREQEILILVAQGASNKAIAQQLFISANTVKVHLHNIFSKIGANTRTEAALIAIRSGLYHPGDGSSGNGQAGAAGQAAADRAGDGLAVEAIGAPTGTGPTARGWRGPAWLYAAGIVVLAGILFIAYSLWQSRAEAPQSSVTLVVNPNFQWENHPAPQVVGVPPEAGGNQTPTVAQAPAVAAAGGVIYLAGGERFQVYDPASQTWQDLPAKPTAALGFGAGMLDGRLYAPGGVNAAGEVLAVLEIYSPESGTWERGPDLPHPLSRYALAVSGGALYLFGGWDGQEAVNSVLRYNPGEGRWETLSPMPAPASDMAAVTINDTIQLFGGAGENGILTGTWIFTPGEDGGSWKPGEALPASGDHLCAGSILDFTFLFIHDSRQATPNSAWQHTGDAGGWYPFLLPAVSLESCQVVAVGTRIFIFGNPAEPGGDPVFQSIQAIYTTHIPNVRQPEK